MGFTVINKAFLHPLSVTFLRSLHFFHQMPPSGHAGIIAVGSIGRRHRCLVHAEFKAAELVEDLLLGGAAVYRPAEKDQRRLKDPFV